MDELWQLYDEQGVALSGKGETKDEVFSKGLLHGAAHVWIWRLRDDVTEVLLQKRAPNKRTWPNRYDISAAGHIDLDEAPLDAAQREAKEEINLDAPRDDLQLFGVHRAHLKTENGAIENEFQWLYSLKLAGDTTFSLQATEVELLVWVSIDQFKAECRSDQCVPHTGLYYDTVAAAIEYAANPT